MKKSRIEKQKESIEFMIDLYCRKKHKTKEVLCDECRELLQYANFRLDHCRFGENKPNCGGCKIHCYKKEMREKIIKVMKFSGPRSLIYNPKIAFEHLVDKLKYK
ncbi:MULTISPECIES: nitrous oxide-stimulated promoter family protein [Clostridium]|uniref:nitrous oxide-stimulated promoter family protein n=1 Tax=Clostridium TaxID=1485 RepID=UPI00090C1483|nr:MULTISPECIES: nitrous oxide-stimulated promoter family protein [Clostridium]APF26384.1 nitrous oxide-stimulated promoter family protein [Clostridium sporogenes]MDI6921545.1 nitrous oxide-stimulated promoter family protein [Clostridium botulinum]WMU99053.1 nitrous oxide-stimulated promoter family protein [Clostridium botulinum]